jgi:LmbE family N-acetylglucosaminyl deacetylase
VPGVAGSGCPSWVVSYRSGSIRPEAIAVRDASVGIRGGFVNVPPGTAGTGRMRAGLRAAASQVKPIMVRTWRRALLARSVDETEASVTRSALVLAPHPDDETLGCGALIAAKRSVGARVRVVVATDGRFSHRSNVIDADALARLRREESIRACAVLGVEAPEVVHLGLVEGTTGEQHRRVTALLRQQVESFGPDDVLVTSALDWHADHRALNRCAREAVDGVSDVRLLEYPVWAWADGPWANAPGRSAMRALLDLVAEPVSTVLGAQVLRVVMSEAHRRTKEAALGEYLSQTTNVTGESTWAVMGPEFIDLFLGDSEVLLRADRSVT